MAKRMILMLTVTLARALVKFQQIQTAIAEGAAFQPPPEAVTTIVAAADEWPATLSVIGTIAAVQGVTVSADFPARSSGFLRFGHGRMRGRRHWRSRHAAGAGAVAAIEAQRDLARVKCFDRMQGLLNEQGDSTAEFDRATAEFHQSGRAGRRDPRRDRAEILYGRRSPGGLGLRQVNLGQYLAGGDPLVMLQSLNPIYVNFGVPQQSLVYCGSGRTLVRSRPTT